MSGDGRWLLLLVPLLCGCGVGGAAPVGRPAPGQQRLGLSVSPEVRFGSPVLGPEGAYQGAGVVAVGDQVSLVVWEDDRDGETDLYGTRLDPQGGVMDSTGIPIATGPERQRSPVVAFDGTNFLVAWIERGAIRAIQVDPQGRLPDPVPKTVVTLNSNTGNTTLGLAAAAEGYLLAWSALSIGAEDVRAIRLSLAGVPLDATPILIAPAAGLATLPTVASDGTGFLVAWVDQRVQPANVRAARISPAGGVLDPGGFRLWASAQFQSAPSAAFNDGAYLVSWASSTQISAVLIDPGGAVLAAVPVSIDAAPAANARPKVTRLGTGFLVAWQWNDKTLRAVRLASSGAVLDPGGIVITPAGPGASASDVGGDGTQAWVVWSSLTLPDVHAARVDGNGTLVDTAGVLLTSAVNSQVESELAFGADAGLVAWTGFAGGQPRIHAVAQEGDGASSPASWVSDSTVTGATLALSASPTGYLVAWSSGIQPQVQAVRLTLEGTPIDASPLMLGEGLLPAVGFDGENHLVLWPGLGLERGSLRCSRISAATGLLTPAPLPIPTSSLYPGQVTLAFDGTGYLALWSDSLHDCVTRALRLTAQGTPLDMDGDAIPIGPNACKSPPRVAFGHDSYLVVWSDYEGASDLGIFGRWVTPAGELKAEPFQIAGGPGNQDVPAVAFDGEGFVVAWEDLRTGARQVQAATVSADGQVSGAQAVTSGGQPRLSSTYPGRTALAYLDFDASPAIGTRQLGLRFLVRAAPGTAGVVPDLGFRSPPTLPAQCGRRWEVPAGAVSEPGQYGFQLAVAPEGMSVEPDTGWLSWLPDRSQQGHHRVRLELSAGGRLAFKEFVVEVRCGPSALRVGCQAAAGGPGLLAVWLWWLVARRRARKGGQRFGSLKEVAA